MNENKIHRHMHTRGQTNKMWVFRNETKKNKCERVWWKWRGWENSSKNTKKTICRVIRRKYLSKWEHNCEHGTTDVRGLKISFKVFYLRLILPQIFDVCYVPLSQFVYFFSLPPCPSVCLFRAFICFNLLQIESSAKNENVWCGIIFRLFQV